MRKTPRPTPDIKILDPKEFKEALAKEPTLARTKAAFGTDEKGQPCIHIINMAQFDEALCLVTLDHEMEHWAQYLYLNKMESDRMEAKYREAKRRGETPFIEWINPFEGGYDLSRWQKKYGHKPYFTRYHDRYRRNQHA